MTPSNREIVRYVMYIVLAALLLLTMVTACRGGLFPDSVERYPVWTCGDLVDGWFNPGAGWRSPVPLRFRVSGEWFTNVCWVNEGRVPVQVSDVSVVPEPCGLVGLMCGLIGWRLKRVDRNVCR